MGNDQQPVDQNAIRRRGVGLRALNREKAFPGYTLFAPRDGQGEVYLIDLEGTVVHQWKLPYRPGLYGYLLPNGNLFYNGKTPLEGPAFLPTWAAIKGGIVLEADWKGNILWEYRHPDHHHDGRRMRNGNALLLGLGKVPGSLVPQIKGGVPGTESNGDIYAEEIHEVSPEGEIVWTWQAHEHLDPDLDIIHPYFARNYWTHGNSLEEMADGNILLSMRVISTVVIIDKKSGEIVWRLGSDVLAQQHCPTELPNGNILIFDNGPMRRGQGAPYSRVIEVDRQSRQIVWQFADTPVWNFFSAMISGAQRLPNGNTLITDGMAGRFFEVTREGEVVWEYVNPYFAAPAASGGGAVAGRGELNLVFRAYRYSEEELRGLV